jgi:hypothetical protein
VTRRAEREQRERQAISEVLDGVLANWGIELSDDPDTTGYEFAQQIGVGEAVEYHEVYGLILDACKEVFTMTGKTDAPTVSRQAFNDAALEAHRAQHEVLRLRSIIATAYGHQGWDIGTVKAILIPGLKEASDSHAHVHTWGPPIGRPRARTCMGCGTTRSEPAVPSRPTKSDPMSEFDEDDDRL